MTVIKRISIILLCLLVAAAGFSFAAYALPEESGTAGAEAEVSTVPETPFETEEPTEPATDPGTGDDIEPDLPEPNSYLFIGNSKTYVNNLPGMYAEMVEAGTGDEISYTTLTYASRSELEHAAAIRAVLRTGGDAEQLTDAEKEYFAQGGVKDEMFFDPNVYEKYREVLLDEEGDKHTFEYIVLQLYAADLDMSLREQGIQSIIEDLAGPTTKVVINFPQGKVSAGNTPFKITQTQLNREEEMKGVLSKISQKVNCQSIVLALTGRATCNYFLYDGLERAQNEVPEEYTIYLAEDLATVQNDLVVSDRSHPTQLGSYLFASVLYTTVYGKNAADTVSAYHAESQKSAYNISGLKNGKNYAKKNGSFGSEAILKRTANLAYRTQTDELHLPLPAPEITKLVNKDKGVKLTWNKVEGAASYRVFRKATDGEWTMLAETTKCSYADETAKAGITYQYGVSCLAQKKVAISSNYTLNKQSIRVLSAPALKSAASAKAGVLVKWKKAAGADHYYIYRRIPNGKWKKVGNTTALRFTDASAKSGTTYEYTVRACYGSERKSTYGTHTLSVLYLAVPRVLNKTAKKKAFSLKWTDTEGPVTGYAVQYSRNKAFTGTSGGTKYAKGAAKLSKTVKNLKKKKTYYVRVRAYKKVKGVIWRSAWSTVVKIKTK